MDFSWEPPDKWYSSSYLLYFWAKKCGLVSFSSNGHAHGGLRCPKKRLRVCHGPWAVAPLHIETASETPNMLPKQQLRKVEQQVVTVTRDGMISTETLGAAKRNLRTVMLSTEAILLQTYIDARSLGLPRVMRILGSLLSLVNQVTRNGNVLAVWSETRSGHVIHSLYTLSCLWRNFWVTTILSEHKHKPESDP
ncbi:hypothetical protein DFH09DRAFT_1069457 [Mycena vulgaris]|nr:hypothetical protein DFH09DRAFT_1069457 [Mycena vulgaris]